MPFDFIPARLQRRVLRGRTTLQLDDAEGSIIAVESGCLWLTMQNDSRDVVLSPGMSFEIDRSGRTLVTAEKDTRFGLLAPGGHRESIAAWFARKILALRAPRVTAC